MTRFSTDTTSVFFWVIYQNFRQGDDLHLTWIFQDKVVTTITKKTDSKTGVAFGEFVRPDAGWPEGIHTVKIEGEGNKTEVTFSIESGPTERTVFDFGSPEGVSCQDLITVAEHWISVQTPDFVLDCSPPYNSIHFHGDHGFGRDPRNHGTDGSVQPSGLRQPGHPPGMVFSLVQQVLTMTVHGNICGMEMCPGIHSVMVRFIR